MTFLTREEVIQAAARIDSLSPTEKFALEIEMTLGNPLRPQEGWSEFYPPKSISREDLDKLAHKVASEGRREVEITNAPEPLIIWFLRRAFGPKTAPLVFRVR